MGRQLRRVPKDFSWPRGKVWEGYRNPHYIKCSSCDGRGTTDPYRRFEEFARRIAVAGEASHIRPDDFVVSTPRKVKPREEVLQDLYFRANMARICGHDVCKGQDDTLPRWPWPEHNVIETILKAAKLSLDDITDLDRSVLMKLARLTKPTVTYKSQYAIRQEGTHKLRCVSDDYPIERVQNYPHPYLGEDGIGDVGTNFQKVAIAVGANNEGFGWDGAWTIMKNIFKAIGLPMTLEKSQYSDTMFENYDWGRCEAGCDDGVDPAHVEAYKAWEDYEPPTGDGYQLWETTSEGSPTSPVFDTLDELCAWAADNATTFGSFRASKEEWKRMLDVGFVQHTEGNITFI